MPATRPKKEQRKKKNFRTCRCKSTCHKLLSRSTRQRHYKKLTPDERKYRARSLSSGSESLFGQLPTPSIRSNKSINESDHYFDIGEATGVADQARGSESAVSEDIFPVPRGVEDLGSEQDNSSTMEYAEDRVEHAGVEADFVEDQRSEQDHSSKLVDTEDWRVKQDSISELEVIEDFGSAGAEKLESEESEGAKSDVEAEDSGLEQSACLDDEDSWARYDEREEHLDKLTHEEKLKQIDDILLLERSIEEWKTRTEYV